MTKDLRQSATLALALALPAAAATAQYTGTSHPDQTPAQVPVVTSTDGVSQPVVYVPMTPAAASASSMMPAPAPAAELKLRPETESDAAPAALSSPAPPQVREDMDARIVGDEPISAHPAVFTTSETLATPPGQRALPDIDAGVVTRIDGPPNRLPEGTLVKTRLLQSVSTKSTVEGSAWRAEVLEPLMRDGRVLIPAGSMLKGRVTEVYGGKRISGGAAIHLQTISIELPDGTTRGLEAQVIDTSLYHDTKVDHEGTIVRRDRKAEDTAVLGLTAGSGAAAGALIAGVPGALVGAGIGAGVTGVLWLRQDRQAELPRGAEVTFELTRSLSVGQE